MAKKRRPRPLPVTQPIFWTARPPFTLDPEEALETDAPSFIANALGTIARARGMAKIAKKAGLSRESLYKALSADGNPEFGTVIRVMQALGLRFTVA